MDASAEIDIAHKAWQLREWTKTTSVCAPDLVSLLKALPTLYDGMKVEQLLDDEMPFQEATIDTDARTLYIRASVYQALLRGDPRARFTVAHELGHFILGHKGKLHRKGSAHSYATAKERRQENEADTFASYFLIPNGLAESCTTATDIENRFQVSAKAAEIAKERIERNVRRQEGKPRKLPPNVVNFLKEAQARGRTLKTDLSEYD